MCNMWCSYVYSQVASYNVDDMWCEELVGCIGCRRCVGCLFFIDDFPQKSPIISGSFAEKDLPLKACCESSPPCMGWLRLVGPITLQVSFAEHSLFYRALLPKRPVI